MGMKYCPKCRKVVLTKALQNYSQVDFKGYSWQETENRSSGRGWRVWGELVYCRGGGGCVG